MAKKTSKPNFERYQYGALAGILGSSEDGARFAPGALEVLAGSKGLNLGEDALGFIRGTQASEDGIKTAIQTYAGQFEEKRGAYKPGELAGWYNPVVADLDSSDRGKIFAVLNDYDEPIEVIKGKYKDAETITKASDRLFTPEQKAKAKKVQEKYGKVLLVMQTLDAYKFETLRGDAVGATRKTELKSLASKL